MKGIFSAAVAILSGLIVLLGYFIPIGPLAEARTTLVGWAVILLAFAALIGVFNLVRSHWRRLTRKQERDGYSLFLVAAFLVTAVAGFWLTPASPAFQHVVTDILAPLETSFMAVLALSLAYVCLRLFSQRRGLMTFVFVFSALAFLVLRSGFLAGAEEAPLLKEALAWIQAIPSAGGRGILLGIALGSLTAGLRVLLGYDRPYQG